MFCIIAIFVKYCSTIVSWLLQRTSQFALFRLLTARGKALWNGTIVNPARSSPSYILNTNWSPVICGARRCHSNHSTSPTVGTSTDYKIKSKGWDKTIWDIFNQVQLCQRQKTGFVISKAMYSAVTWGITLNRQLKKGVNVIRGIQLILLLELVKSLTEILSSEVLVTPPWLAQTTAAGK